VLINVATLVQEHVGSSREVEFVDEPISLPEFDYQRVVNGSARLICTERGVLVTAKLTLPIPIECARCLQPIEEQLTFEFDEEFVLSIRHPLTRELPAHDQEDFLIDEHWLLDLSEAVRQYEQSAVPLVPLCRSDCPGFLPEIPAPLTSQPTGRWAALSGLAAQLHEEETDGPSQA
jgi:uncharacterized protein